MNIKNVLLGLYLIAATIVIIILTLINFESLLQYFLTYKPVINFTKPIIVIGISIFVLWICTKERKQNGSTTISRTSRR